MLRWTDAGGALPVAIACAPEDGGGAAAAEPTASASPESVLFGGDKPAAPAAPSAEAKTADGAAKDGAEVKAEDAKPEDGEKPAEKGEAKKADDPLDAVPEDGKYALKMPDGIDLDQPLLDAVSPMLKAKGYTQREAQDFANEFIKVQQARVTQQQEAWGRTVAGWADEAKADKDIGGAKWDATVIDARRAINSLGTPALREYLDATGGGNHPEMIRFMAKVGAMTKEDNPAIGGPEGAAKPAGPEAILFPNDVPKGR